jgi:acyl carrier protein
MTNGKPEREICDFILNELPAAARLQMLAPEDSLLALGVLDSAGLIEILAFCEQRYGVKIADADLRPANFESVSAIARMVKRAQSGAAADTCLQRLFRWLGPKQDWTLWRRLRSVVSREL